MKIGIYDPYLDDLGGGEKYMMTIAECLAKHHDVDLFWDNKKDLDELTQRFSLNIPTVTVVKNIFSQRVSFIEKIMTTRRYDALIVLSDGSIPLVLSKKLFLHVQQPLDNIDFASLKEKLKGSRVNGFFYNSKFTESFNEKIFPKNKSNILYPPVSITAREMKKENIILHVGRFRVKNVGVEDYKKQGVMIEAFKKMVDQGFTNWKFFIAASVKEKDEEKFSKLRKNAKGYPIEFLINKSNDELWDIYNRAKIYWHASGYGEDLKAHPEFAEHFGISTVEAMGAGVVPIVINAGGQKEIVSDGENGFLWDTLDELREKTKKVANDQSLFEKLSKQAKKRAKDFSKETFCKKIHMLLSNEKI